MLINLKAEMKQAGVTISDIGISMLSKYTLLPGNGN